jgi:hypothetical protein
MQGWFNEFPLYNGEPIGQGNFEGYGHYTQLLWPTTTGVGCAKAINGNAQVITCEYTPPGNVVGYILDVKIGAYGQKTTLK